MDNELIQYWYEYFMSHIYSDYDFYNMEMIPEMILFAWRLCHVTSKLFSVQED